MARKPVWTAWTGTVLIKKDDHVKFNYNRNYASVEMCGVIEKIGRKFAYIHVKDIDNVGAHKIVNAFRIPFVDVLEVMK